MKNKPCLSCADPVNRCVTCAFFNFSDWQCPCSECRNVTNKGDYKWKLGSICEHCENELQSENISDDSMNQASLGNILLSRLLEQSVDPVNHPSHYNTGKIEVIDAIEDWGLGFNLGNVVKYVARSSYKGNRIQDLKKALWYLQREIGRKEKDEND